MCSKHKGRPLGILHPHPQAFLSTGRPTQPDGRGWEFEEVAANFGYSQEANHTVGDAAGNLLVPTEGEIP